jgi:IrrE N-terminal-like domain
VIDNYELRGYVVAPRNILSIRESAKKAYEILELDKYGADLTTFLERLSIFGVTYDVMDDDNLSIFDFGAEAVCVPENATILLSEATYHKACQNDPRTKFTIFHELGHLVLGHNKLLHRKDLTDIKCYVDSEWQADQFSAEITMPLHVINDKNLKNARLIEIEFGVSAQAAARRISQLTKRNEI